MAAAAPREGDLTARARIRDAAIACFASQGFGASFTTIAAAAGVSPGLITHHFRSKAALRDECDAEVLRRFREVKTEGLADLRGALAGHLANPEINAELLVYSLRAIHDGGEAARSFLDHLVDSARGVMADAVAAGMIRPSADEEARLRYLTYQGVGAMLVHLLSLPHASPEEFVASVQATRRDQLLPTLELFTDGLLTSRQMLNDYLDYVGDPPSHGKHADAATA